MSLNGDWSIATKENLSKLSGISYYPSEGKIDYKITATDRARLNSVYENNAVLRKKLSDYCQIKCAESGLGYNPFFYTAIECELSETYVRKIIRGDKPVTRNFLGAFCVGMGLTPEESEELFELTGNKLTFGFSYFDSITMCAIRDGDNIEDYLADLEKYTDDSIG